MASQWFYRQGTEEIGPVSVNQIRSLAKTGTIVPTTLIRKSEDSTWIKASRIKGLFDGDQTVPQVAEPEGSDEEGADPLVALISQAASSVASVAGSAASAIGSAVSGWIARRNERKTTLAQAPQTDPIDWNSLAEQPSPQTLIGIADAVCPYCNQRQEKMPGRKKKCPHCNNFIFVRTRPQDKAKVLVREDQLSAIEEQWSAVNGENSLAFGRSSKMGKTQLPGGRVSTEHYGVDDATSQGLTRELTDGLALGMNPREVARNIQERVEGFSGIDGRQRAVEIAQTEMIRALNEAQLDRLEEYGMDEVGVAVEWSTSGLGKTREWTTGRGKNKVKHGGDPSPCELCAPLQGIVLTTNEARGLLPRHPGCRCSWVPANIGEETKGQKRSQASIQQAIDKSIMAEIPEGSNRPLAEQKRLSTWAGAKVVIAKNRPKSILN